ncbi:MAG: DUF5689 domain-containing protein [Flavobacterium sp.]
MKTMFYKSTFFALAVAATLASCVNDDDYSVPVNSLNCNEPVYTVNLQPDEVPATPVVAAYVDSPANGPDVIEAYVTSSDEGGNFFKTISFQTLDGSFGFSVPVDVTSTFINFEPGRKVYVTLDGSYTDIYNGSLRIGAIYVDPEDGSAQVGRIADTDYRNFLHRSCTVVNEDDLVRTMSIAEAKNDDNLNTLIELENVQFADDAINTNYYDPANDLGGATNHLLTDAAGNTIIFRTSSFANFAGMPVPDGNGTVRGVLTKFGSDYQFMARVESDVQLTNPRAVPLFNDSFSGPTWAAWTKVSVVGAQVWQNDLGNFGNPGGMAKMSGYQGSNQNNEDWLISPAINLTGLTSATLTFDNTSRFDGNLIQVYVSTNYTSGAPNTATWTELTGFNLDDDPLGYIWESSGAININSVTGNANVRIAFKYTSTTAAARTWEIDNVKVVGQ